MYRLTCIYAACKIEENHVSAEELGKGISQDHQMILNNEMIVYQAWTGLEYQIVLVRLFYILNSFMTRKRCYAESGFWSYSLCSIPLGWRFYRLYGGSSNWSCGILFKCLPFCAFQNKSCFLSFYFWFIILWLVCH